MFAVLGTVLSMLQLLVYAVLARSGRRPVLLVWAAFAAVVLLGLQAGSVTGLLTIVLTCDSVLLVALLLTDVRRRSHRRRLRRPGAAEPGRRSSRAGRRRGGDPASAPGRRFETAPALDRSVRPAEPLPHVRSVGGVVPAAAGADGDVERDGEVGGAAHLAAYHAPRARSRSPGATSKTSSSCTWSSIRERQPRLARSRASTWSIATLIRSAAEPWIGALSAIRSAISRRCRLSLVRSGR